MTFSHLLPAILLITSAAAHPFHERQQQPQNPASLRVTHRTNLTGGMNSIISKDRTRAQALLSSQKSSGSQLSANSPNSSTTSVPNIDAGFLALVQVQVGSPPGSSYQLIVDTGSSNTFVGANAPYVRTNTSQDTGEAVAVSYGSGSFSGEEFNDDVTLGSATITQSIGVANQSQGFNGLDGILGLGPDILTQGTLVNNPTTQIQTVTDNLAKQGKAAAALVGISIPLTTGTGSETGSLDFGAPNTAEFTGQLAFVPITGTAPSSEFWGIDQSITYGNETLPILNTTAGIVDTGTTLLLLATEAFQAYAAATGASPDPTTGLLKVANPDNLQSLFFHMGNNTLEFPANAQIFPRSLNTEIGGDSNSTYLIVQDNGPMNQQLDFVNGFTFLQRFYSVFDTPNQQVGFATTPQTTATSN